MTLLSNLTHRANTLRSSSCRVRCGWSRPSRSSAAFGSSPCSGSCCPTRPGTDAGLCWWKARRGVGRRASYASSHGKPRPRARSSSTARATRRCGRRTVPSSKRSLRFSRPMEPTTPMTTGRSPGSYPRSRPHSTRTPSATAYTSRSPTSSPKPAAGLPCSSCSRTDTGRTRRPFCSCATWRGPRWMPES